jgi:hypothetical protein
MRVPEVNEGLGRARGRALDHIGIDLPGLAPVAQQARQSRQSVVGLREHDRLAAADAEAEQRRQPHGAGDAERLIHPDQTELDPDDRHREAADRRREDRAQATQDARQSNLHGAREDGHAEHRGEYLKRRVLKSPGYLPPDPA